MGKEDAFRKTLQLLKRKKPDAIVTTSESLALGIIEGIRLIGYTTVDIPIFTFGRTALESPYAFFCNQFSGASGYEFGKDSFEIIIRTTGITIDKRIGENYIGGMQFRLGA